MATSWRALSLKAALRSALDRSGVSQREVARRLGHKDPMKVNRWLDETKLAPSSEDTEAFLAAITLTGDEHARIMTIAGSADTEWSVGGPAGVNPRLASVLEFERYATHIFEFQLAWWPGLLQCSDYARALISRDDAASPHEVDSRVLIRNARRDCITRKRNPVVFHAAVGRPAIYGRFAGEDVMAAQLDHARDLSVLDNVTIQAVDVGSDWTPGGPFIIYDFEDLPTTVYLEHHRTSWYTVDPVVVAAYKDTAELIRREAMSPNDTARLIADAIPSSSMETT